MNQIIKDSLNNSIDYDNYYRLMQKLVQDKYTTGDVLSDSHVNFTLLNEKCMSRWNKRLKVSNKDKKEIMKFNSEMIWLIISESWCGDAAHILPVLNAVAELNDHFDLRIALRDDNKELMNLFLTDGKRAIPKLIMLNSNTLEVIDSYGPRPFIVTEIVEDFKTKNGQLTPDFKEHLQHWYNQDKGQTIIHDLIDLLEKHAQIKECKM